MPNTATITSFYTFVKNSRARASNVNSNFDTLRGHLISIDPNTSSASFSKEYDLGSTEYRFRTAYLNKLNLSLTTTSDLTLECSTSGTYDFKNNTTTVFQINSIGFSGIDNTPFSGLTSSCAIGGMAISSLLNVTYTGTSTHIPGSTCTIQTNGRPVELFLINADTTTGWVSSQFPYYTATAQEMYFEVRLIHNNTAVSSLPVLAANSFTNNYLPPSFFKYFVTVDKGTHSFSLYVTAPVYSGGSLPNGKVSFINVKLIAYEL